MPPKPRGFIKTQIPGLYHLSFILCGGGGVLNTLSRGKRCAQSGGDNSCVFHIVYAFDVQGV